MQRFAVYALCALAALAAAPRAHATVVQATLCTVNVFPCPLANTIDSGIRANGVGVLGFNRFTALPFLFTDAAVNFTGNIVVTDVLGANGDGIYLWGGGVGSTNLAPPAGGWYLDVFITQSYFTVPTINAPFSEFNSGFCNAAATGTPSGIAATLGVNGGFMPVMGAGFANCSPFNYANGPFPFTIGGLTNLTALAQFYFDPLGGAGQAIDLPWGQDLPDLADFGNTLPDINNPNPFGLLDQAPEPATFTLIGLALGGIAVVTRKRRR